MFNIILTKPKLATFGIGLFITFAFGTALGILSIPQMAFSLGEQRAPGQFSCGPTTERCNPSGGALPPGQDSFGNAGQCQKTTEDHSICHAKTDGSTK